MKDLFFIALVPPADIAAAADDLRHKMWHKHGSSHGLNSPPHITLAPPFTLDGKEEESFKEELAGLCENHAPFSLRLNGTGHFGQKSIFLKVENQPELNHLQKAVLDYLQQQGIIESAEEHPYRPHLTLATRDLKKNRFKAAWEEFKNLDFQKEFTVQEVSLLQHSGKRWLIANSYSLGA